MSITNETRFSAYEEVLDSLGRRQKDVYNELLLLGENGATANELAMRMHEKGFFITPERNRVHPRLHELTKDGILQIKDKRKCKVSNMVCAVYTVSHE